MTNSRMNKYITMVDMEKDESMVIEIIEKSTVLSNIDLDQEYTGGYAFGFGDGYGDIKGVLYVETHFLEEGGLSDGGGYLSHSGYGKGDGDGDGMGNRNLGNKDMRYLMSEWRKYD